MMMTMTTTMMMTMKWWESCSLQCSMKTTDDDNENDDNNDFHGALKATWFPNMQKLLVHEFNQGPCSHVHELWTRLDLFEQVQDMSLQRIQSKSWIGFKDPSIVSCGTVCCGLGGMQVNTECPVTWNLHKQVLESLQDTSLQRIQSKSWIGSKDPSIVSCGTVCCRLGGIQVNTECPVAWNLHKQVLLSLQEMSLQRIQSKSWNGIKDPSIASCGTVCCRLRGM